MSIESVQQIPLELGSRSAMGLENFLIGDSNKDAVAWIDSWPNWNVPVLIVSGPPASGKSHLASVWQEQSGADLVHPDDLLKESAETIASKGKHLIFDGLDPWLGDEQAETMLFHLYNIFKEESRNVLITMRMAPNNCEFAINDLASRLRAAPVAHIHPPDDMLLGSVLIKQFSDRQLKVNNDVIRYILPRMERSFGAVRDLVTAADRAALAKKSGISIPLMRSVLAAMQE